MLKILLYRQRQPQYIGLAGKMKYAAKRHVQSVRQVVRQIKHDGPTLTDL